jgi:hypothetical protein
MAEVSNTNVCTQKVLLLTPWGYFSALKKQQFTDFHTELSQDDQDAMDDILKHFKSCSGLEIEKDGVTLDTVHGSIPIGQTTRTRTTPLVPLFSLLPNGMLRVVIHLLDGTDDDEAEEEEEDGDDMLKGLVTINHTDQSSGLQVKVYSACAFGIKAVVVNPGNYNVQDYCAFFSC